MIQSRLVRRSLKQNRRQLYISLITIVVLIFVTLNFGPILIGTTGSIIDIITGKTRQTTTIVSDADLQPPVLDSIPQATPSSNINITGRGFYEDGKVEFFLNGLKYRTINLDSFEFKVDDVELINGENVIKARTVRNGKISEFTEDYRISYVKDDPKLEIDNPQNQASFAKADQEITVSGKTDAENTVRINGFIAIVDPDGNFSYIFKLNEGENKLNITAENSAGKMVKRELTVSYSP